VDNPSPNSPSPPPALATPASSLKELTSTEFALTKLSPYTPAAFAVVLLNFLTSLHRTKSLDDLTDENSVLIKEALFNLSALFSEKESTTLHLERTVELFSLFPLGDVKSTLSTTLTELDEHRRIHHKKCEKERLKKRLEEFKGGGKNRKENLILTKSDQIVGMDILALVDPKKAKRIKFKRQQREARKKRTVSIKQRNRMYRMIASNEISTLFHLQAKKMDEGLDMEWGDDKLAPIDDPFAVSEDSSSSDDSFDARKKKVIRKVDTTLSELAFKEATPLFRETSSPSNVPPQREGSGDLSDGDSSTMDSSKRLISPVYKQVQPSQESRNLKESEEGSEKGSDISSLSTPAINKQPFQDTDPAPADPPPGGAKNKNGILGWLLRNRSTEGT
jgi:hypothetical protein